MSLLSEDWVGGSCDERIEGCSDSAESESSRRYSGGSSNESSTRYSRGIGYRQHTRQFQRSSVLRVKTMAGGVKTYTRIKGIFCVVCVVMSFHFQEEHCIFRW